MAQSRPTTTTDGAKALAREITSLKRRVRDLELHPDPTSSGFTPIGASIYDGFYSGDPAAEQFNAVFKVSDAGVSGDIGQVSWGAHDPIPPNYTHKWLRYVQYDDGFGASASTFTIPEDGVYLVHGQMTFSLINGHVEDCNLLVRSVGATQATPAFIEGPRDVVPGDADVGLNAAGQARLTAGATVRMSFTINLSGLTGLSSGTALIWIPRRSRAVAPPTNSGDINGDACFSITKISD